MDKRVAIKLNGNRKIIGSLKGYDAFMNLVLENSIEEVAGVEGNALGEVVFFGVILDYKRKQCHPD